MSLSHTILVSHSVISPATHDLLQAVGGIVDPSEPHITGGVHGELDQNLRNADLHRCEYDIRKASCVYVYLASCQNEGIKKKASLTIKSDVSGHFSEDFTIPAIKY